MYVFILCTYSVVFVTGGCASQQLEAPSILFHVLFHSPTGVLFTFPSLYHCPATGWSMYGMFGLSQVSLVSCLIRSWWSLLDGYMSGSPGW